ncbi:MAG: PAS domain S-box protein [Alphaproteobacteria bacterium]|mgnify:CR=1 FL=1|nr:PAS domain S-box protein [Alphaproteobacteria bacterium]MDX5492017.1 PAS domain S-box protein [Alphaproteobacteria bacterium]
MGFGQFLRRFTGSEAQDSALRLAPGRIATIYGILGSIWIVSSDVLGAMLIDKDISPARLYFQVEKGLAFVLVTTILLYVLLRVFYNRLVKAESLLEEQVMLSKVGARVAKVGGWSVDVKSGLVSWSNEAGRILGFPPDEIATVRDASTFFDGESGPRIARAVDACIRKGVPFDDEFDFRREDGVLLHLRVAGQPRQGEAGEITRIEGALQDISEFRQTEISLAESRRQFRELTNAMPHMVWTAKPTGEVDFVTQKYVEYAGLNDEEFAARNWFSTIHPDDVQIASKAWAEASSTGNPYRAEFRFRRKDGEYRWHLVTAKAAHDEKGNITRWFGAAADIHDGKLAEQELSSLANRLSNTLESMSDAVLAIDGNWVVTFMNGQAERMLRVSRGQIVGRNIWDMFPDARGSLFQKEYEAVIETQTPTRFTEYFPPLDGWFDVHAYPTPDGIALYFRDVTAERAREQRLKLLDVAVNHQADLLLITEAHPVAPGMGRKIVYVNDALTRLFGYTADEVLGKTPDILVDPDAGQDELGRVRQVMAQGLRAHGEFAALSKDGRRIWLEADLAPVRDEKGELTHWVAVERDVTERRQKEEQLRISDERYRLATLATHDVIWDWDFEAETIVWNDNMFGTLGFDPAEVPLSPEFWESRIHEEDRDRVLDGLYGVVNGTESNWTDQYRFMHADGRALSVIDRGFILRDETGKAIRMVGSIIDVTEQRSLEERMRQSQKMEVVGQMTGGVAHDFNNLLTVILGNAELLADQLQDRERLKALAEMTASAAQRGAQLTHRLLAFARRQPLEPKPVDVNGLVAGMEGLFRGTFSEDIEIDLAPRGDLWVTELDPGQLEVALLNLVVNARDAMPDGGKLTIETDNVELDADYASRHNEVEPGDYVMISVSDTGCGMSKEVVERAFEPFFTTKDVGKGSGLGLSMVFGFVKQSGGHAKIYSEEGEGTTVRLYFPRVKSGQVEAVEHRAIDDVAGGSEHILVVEDDTLVRDHLVAQLRDLGYRVTDASSGPEAYEIIKRMDDIDLLFTDVVMPGGMNGRQLADAALKLRPGLKVLYTSGYTENAIIHHGRLDPGVHLLSKPYRRQEMAAKVRKALE